MILYLDNIRGFSNQFIELNEVNFFVGENSTGKSSVISIISLLSDYSFGLAGEFKNQFVDFGPFSEIVNKAKNSQKIFSIGLKKQKHNLSDFSYDEILINYKEEDGFPVADSLSIRVKDINLSFKIFSKKIEWKIFENKIFDTNDDWVVQHNSLNIVLQEGEINNSTFPLLEIKRSPLSVIFYISRIVESPYLKLFRDRPFFRENVLQKSIWIDPLRSKPQRIYEPKKINYSAEGEHIPTVLRDIFLSKNDLASEKVIEELKAFGKSSGLFDDIKIDQYRKSKDSPFSLIFKMKNKSLKISNIGYGVSQIIPILTEVLRQSNNNIFLIQQPEVHLHPRSQAFFGQFIFEQFFNSKKQFIIETHSDFIIDRFRLMIRKNENSSINSKVNVLFFESDGKNNIVTKIDMDKSGNYPANQPKKFREFFLKEELEILGF